MLYIAYGSNLNKSQMARRCPKATAVTGFVMPNHKLVFNGVADLVYEEGARAHVGLWRITKDCERALDRYEGVDLKRPTRGLYRKDYVRLRLTHQGQHIDSDALLYTMNHGWPEWPTRFYFEAIQQGFADFGLDDAPLHEALDTLEQMEEEAS